MGRGLEMLKSMIEQDKELIGPLHSISQIATLDSIRLRMSRSADYDSILQENLLSPR